jgi:hypothetical protein
MPRLVVGILAGVLIGILATLGLQRAWEVRDNAAAGRTVEVMDVVPVVMERALPGLRVLDLSLQSPSTHDVGYQYEALYDAHITYQLNGRIKRVILPFGRTKDGLIFPSTTEVVVADDKAEVIETLGGSQGASVQPNNEMQRTRPAQATEPRR